jgi:hypothetical protein|tara:strand:- start:1335 stop:4772 length:3438 start_codon:yes stop_codon:yes gene_type:complete
MADGNKIFVSPGVYTSEKDLTFVAQSVGVTTLGIVGETLKGPAFEPIYIQSFDDFTTRFGGTSPMTYVDSQIPKYELGYIAKSYLSQSNQLFVTRVLGISGYDAGPSWSVMTIGEIDGSSVTASTTTTGSVQTLMTYYVPLTGANGTIGTNFSQNDSLRDDFFVQLPGNVASHFFTGAISSAGTGNTNTPFTLNNGTTLPNLQTSFESFISGTYSPTTVSSGSSCFIGNATGIFSGGSASGVTSWSCPLIYQYGCIPQNITNTASAATVLSLSAESSAVTITNVISTNCVDYSSYENDSWYYGLFDYQNDECCTGTTYSGVSYQLWLSGQCLTGLEQACSGVTGTTTAGTAVYSGTVVLDTITYSGVKSYTDYDGMVVLTLRSRGLSTKASGGPLYALTANTASFDCTGDYAKVLDNPFASFGVSATTTGGNVYTFKTSMANTSQDYVSRVFGRSPFDKKESEVPLFVEETYPALLTDGWKKGKIRGLQCCFKYLPSARDITNTNTIAWNMNEWTTPETPWIVSELQGTDVFRLFKFVSISDGTSANREIKVSMINLSFERGEFDVIVRDFYDTDANPQVLEKYTRCSLDPTKVSFIGRKIGTSTGEFELKSKYTMLYLGEGLLDGVFKNSLPAGFEGYRFRGYDCPINPRIVYKTKYYKAGQVVYDPPFGSGTANNQTISGGDKLSKVYLGVSNSIGAAYDPDFFDYKGKQVPSTLCTAVGGAEWNVITPGFHMDSGATVVIGGLGTYLDWSGTTLNGKSVFECGVGQFNHEPTLSTEPYKQLRSRKFTVVPHGGFDGWDIYRKTRSNSDDYRMGLSGFLAGQCAGTSEFPLATGKGTFKKLSSTEANTDYFAYLRGIETFSNPEAVNINVFTTPGIDYVDNLGLVNEAIDMVETDRADSLYVVTTPDYNMFVSSTTDPANQITPEESVDNLEDSLIDSNYTATYYPWIQIRDTANNKQIFIPPTSEVMRNIALTDNIAFPWFASAGYTRGIVNAIKARKKLTLDERDTLYVGRLNPIATFSDVGPIIWGNKTLQIRESALDRINVRRLLLQTRKLISAVSIRLLFEQNDDVVRQQFLDLVNPILDSIRRDRGLTDFRVVLSNDPEEIDRNEMNGKIYIKPTRALEYIFVEFLITPTGASFEDV